MRKAKLIKETCRHLVSQCRSFHTGLPGTPRCSLKRDIDKHVMMASLNGIATQAPRRWQMPPAAQRSHTAGGQGFELRHPFLFLELPPANSDLGHHEHRNQNTLLTKQSPSSFPFPSWIYVYGSRAPGTGSLPRTHALLPCPSCVVFGDLSVNLSSQVRQSFGLGFFSKDGRGFLFVLEK